MTAVKDYFGKDLPASACWPLELQLHENHRQDEATIQRGRWFDYRQLLPAQATYLFAAQYRFEYLEAYKRTQDIGSVSQINPFSPEDIFKSTELVSLWLARREADQIGCKYDFYLRLAFDRFADRGWKNLPRPNQLYSEDLTQDVTAAWKARCRAVLQLAESSFFACDAFVSHPDQVEYHTWVVEQIKVRDHKHLALARVLKNSSLPLELAGREFGADLIRRAQQFSLHA